MVFNAYAEENLVQNGSFEYPVVDENTVINDGELPGWDINYDQELCSEHNVILSGDMTDPYHGDQFIALDSQCNISISQTINTVMGEYYSFSYSERTNEYIDEMLSIKINGEELYLFRSYDDRWFNDDRYFFYAFGPTTIEFTNLSTNSSNYLYLDDIKIIKIDDHVEELPIVHAGDFEIGVLCNGYVGEYFTRWITENQYDDDIGCEYGLETQHTRIFESYNGHRYAELDSACSKTISQIIYLIPGETYELSYASKARPASTPETNGLLVKINGHEINRIETMSNDWYVDTHIFNSTGPTLIEFSDIGESDGKGTLIDTIKVIKTDIPIQNAITYNSTIGPIHDSVIEDDNLIINGGFEAPIMTVRWDGHAKSIIFPSYWESIMKLGDDQPYYYSYMHSSEEINDNGDRNQYVELYKEDENILSQTIKTIPGETYELSFSQRMQYYDDEVDYLKIIIDNNIVSETKPTSEDWETITTTFNATGSTTKIHFSYTSYLYNSDYDEIHLDNIRVIELD